MLPTKNSDTKCHPYGGKAIYGQPSVYKFMQRDPVSIMRKLHEKYVMDNSEYGVYSTDPAKVNADGWIHVFNQTDFYPFENWVAMQKNIFIDSIPINHDMDNWNSKIMDKYIVTLKNENKAETFEYSQGIGHRHMVSGNYVAGIKPFFANVLHCFIMDYNMFQEYDLISFLSEFGYGQPADPYAYHEQKMPTLRDGEICYQQMSISAMKIENLFSRSMINQISEESIDY